MSQKTVLLVEDQVEFCAIYSLYLERHGYRVLIAQDGEEAVELAHLHHPDMILMDASLPRMDGLLATQHLKQQGTTRNIPVILLTALSYGAVGRRAREVGCDGFVAKPCEPLRVLREVQQWIGS